LKTAISRSIAQAISNCFNPGNLVDQKTVMMPELSLLLKHPINHKNNMTQHGDRLQGNHARRV
jgi:hypothetical protein